METRRGERARRSGVGVSIPIALHPVFGPSDSGRVLTLPPNRPEAAFRPDFGGISIDAFRRLLRRARNYAASYSSPPRLYQERLRIARVWGDVCLLATDAHGWTRIRFLCCGLLGFGWQFSCCSDGCSPFRVRINAHSDHE